MQTPTSPESVEEYVPETPEHGSPPYTIRPRASHNGETKPYYPVEDPITSYSPLPLPYSTSPPYSPTIEPGWASPWTRPPPPTQPSVFRPVPFTNFLPTQPAAPKLVKPATKKSRGRKHPGAPIDHKRTPEGGSDVDSETPILRWGSPPIHLQHPPRELRKRRPRSPSPLSLDADLGHGRMKQRKPTVQSTRKAPALNFFVVGRRALRKLTSTAATMLSDLMCTETMP